MPRSAAPAAAAAAVLAGRPGPDMNRPRLSWRPGGGWHARWRDQRVYGYATPWGAAWGAWQLAQARAPGRRPWLIRRPGRPMPWWRFRALVAANYWHRFQLRHLTPKSELQRAFEAGDPGGRVQAAADRVIAELEHLDRERGGDQ
jgi:hypothetical protein